MARFFRFPFGLTGDRNSIPDPVQPGGGVSFTQGFGPDYEIAPGDPGWKPVPRPETNSLYYDITDNIRQYQLFGAPEWVDASQNGGVAVSYAINAVVRHNDLVYRSLVANNTVEPGTDATKWGLDIAWGMASTAIFGVVRYATNPEAVARTATDRALTPSNLGAALDALLLNNPAFPEVLAAGGIFTLSNPAGNVRIAAGTDWILRGAYKFTSVQTDLPTVASKTYHLRWDKVNGFALYDLASGSYNPGALPETDPSFDTTYDNMLVARAVTSAGNAATITPLVNKDRLTNLVLANKSITRTSSASAGGNWNADVDPITLNWARTPAATASMSRYGYAGALSIVPEEVLVALTGSSADGSGTVTAIFNRYTFKPLGTIDLNDPSVSRTFAIQLAASLVA